MDVVVELFNAAIEHLLGRASGPLYFRLFVMPTVVTVLAIRAGLRDVPKDRPSFMAAMVTAPGERNRLFRSATKDVGRIFLVAIVLDTVYQLLVLRAVYLLEVLIVAVACAVVPYVVVRGPVTVLTRFLVGKRRPSPPPGDSGTGNESDAARH